MKPNTKILSQRWIPLRWRAQLAKYLAWAVDDHPWRWWTCDEFGDIDKSVECHWMVLYYSHQAWYRDQGDRLQAQGLWGSRLHRKYWYHITHYTYNNAAARYPLPF